ncbi:hypothetical protein CR195_019750 [Bacillus cereus]|nr:Bro-N domain-containing protein [Bacillus cereus]PYD97096.1 hypothetical protein CR195_019750 [Bacillus cereus]
MHAGQRRKSKSVFATKQRLYPNRAWRVKNVDEEDKVLNNVSTLGEEPLFLAKDVAEWIEYSKSNVNKMINSVDEEERTIHTISTSGSYKTEAWFLTEDGIYEVLMQSRKPIAKQWKTEEATLIIEYSRLLVSTI